MAPRALAVPTAAGPCSSTRRKPASLRWRFPKRKPTESVSRWVQPSPILVSDQHSRLMNAPNFAVVLNCGIGSSSLNAEVKAFERLHIVRDANSGYGGSK